MGMALRLVSSIPGPTLPRGGQRWAPRGALLVLLALLLLAGPAWSQSAGPPDPAEGGAGSAPEQRQGSVPAEGPGEAQVQASPFGAVQRAIARETQRARDHLEALESFETKLALREGLEEKENREALAGIAGFSAELSFADPAGRQLTDIYYRILGQLREERERMGGRLDAWGEPYQIPTFSPELSLSALDIPQFQEPLRKLRELVDRARSQESELRAAVQALRVRALKHEAERIQSLHRVRIAAIRRLEFGGWGKALADPREALAALYELFEQLGLLGRYEIWRRWQSVREMASISGILSAFGSISYSLIEVLLVVVVLRWLLGRFRRFAETKRIRQERWWRDRPRRRLGWLSFAEILVPWFLFLIGVWAVGGILGGALRWPEMEFLLLVAWLYGAYRLALGAFSGGIALVGDNPWIFRMSRARQADIVGSVRTVFRTGCLLSVILLPLHWITGGGLLYDLLLWIAVLAFCAITLLTLARWQVSILDTYCGIGRERRLRGWVGSTRHGWRAWVAAPIAFLSLVWTIGVSLAEEAAFRYRSTRHLLTDLSRRRLDSKTEPAGQSVGAPRHVPPPLAERMSCESVDEGLLLPRFPGQEGLSHALVAWRAGESRGAFLLTGEQGVGKRTWLRRVPLGNGAVARASLDRRVANAAELAQFLGPKIAGEEATAWDADRLRETLLQGPPRVIVLGACERLFLSCVGGYRVLDAFLDLVEATGSRVFWLCSMVEGAWSHLRAVRGHPAPFRWHETLDPWGEEEIRELIRRRVEASGVRVAYDALRLSGAGMQPLISGSAGLEADYFRILWDRAMGNPSAALGLFLRSVAPRSPSEVGVGLFREPEARDLEVGKDAASLLSALTTHGALTVEEAAAVLHLPQAHCAIAVGRLEDVGAVCEDQGRYQIDPCWYPTVKRSLKEKNLLFA